jgi:serine/threonine-protein kinase
MRVTRHTRTKRQQDSLTPPHQPRAPQTPKPLPPEDLEPVSPAGEAARELGEQPVDPGLINEAMVDDRSPDKGDKPAMVPNPFAEEAVRVMASASVATSPDPGTLMRQLPPDPRAPIVESDEHPGRPRRTWPWIIVIVVTVAVVWTAYVMLTNRNNGGPQLASVPGVVGLSENEAMAKIKAAGFRYTKEGVQPSADLAQDVVVRQDPQQSAKLEKGRIIGYWISSGTGRTDVPSVVGMSQETAAAKLVAAGLVVATKTEVSGAQPVGTVLRQNPDATMQVDAGTIVTITVASATNTVTVPLLSGMSQEAALTALSSMHLTATVKPVASQLPGGTVVGQSPAAGTGVQPGTAVTVEVSNAPGPTTVMVPAVAALGLTQSQAKAELAQYGLKARVINLPTPNFRPGLCIYQQPAAGVQVKIGSTVSITIARVPPTTTTASPPST